MSTEAIHYKYFFANIDKMFTFKYNQQVNNFVDNN